MSKTLLVLFLCFSLCQQETSCAEVPVSTGLLRWTGAENQASDLASVLSHLEKKIGTRFQTSDFILQDERDLAFNHYQRFVQIRKGMPIEGKSIRIWSERNNTRAIQVEALLELPPVNDDQQVEALAPQLSDEETMVIIHSAMNEPSVNDTDDHAIRGMEWLDQWQNGELVRVVKVKGKRGKHKITILLRTRLVIQHEYIEFPQAEMDAFVYPIYEESKGKILPRKHVVLKHILNAIPKAAPNLYAPLKMQRYFDNKVSSVVGSSDAGRAQGFWSMAYVKDQAQKIRDSLPMVQNDYLNAEQGGLLLQGKYATINIHPDAFKSFSGVNFKPKESTPFFPTWTESDPSEMVPGQAFYGKPFTSKGEASTRPARRLPNHNPAVYMNDGFDEVQVYYAINTLMESLHSMGFRDPEIATRPFNAFLFNPDISYRNNAFYTDDTINFTTYSPTESNYARDNSTIWHELGHGIMDRLMGDNIALADTGGLSEGMADFVAAIVVQAVTQGKPFPGSHDFRIINKTGFNLTNEVHDDGESYGGAMKDFLDAAIKRDGHRGLVKVTDLILEAMRLTRDYPGLTATDWFNHILFADQLGRAGLRKSGELKPLLMAAVGGRNFHLDSTPNAYFKLMNETNKSEEVIAGSIASRGHPIQLKLAKNEVAQFKIGVSLRSSKDYAFKYPLTIKVVFNQSPLQGAVHWVGEETGARVIVLKSEAETVHIPLAVSGACDAVNREDGSCVDYVHVQIFNQGETNHPVAKKRFYVQVKN